MQKDKVRNQLWSEIPFGPQIFHPCRDLDAHLCPWGLDGFCLVHAKHFEYIMRVLCLDYEGPMFKLLDLKVEKECQLPHHGHLKLIDHDHAKLITKSLIS
jgi:hypothetical protein